ncbi:hypothetical protein LA664_02525 [Lactobacillus amylolyticus]|nr:hypothetical protein [Lactobacillus amylolyticus]KRL15397.1 hypothetical protein FD39_GL001626 [Lactobacillus amylolyticus DSM 11664]QFY04212.1 hypothetical protein LA664_02525 [Lactobacillus amylolyticus]TDG61083.1 hypothetical protein C5L18_001378 [Lactobacillus amylolyticus]
MARKKIELDKDIENLVAKYIDTTEIDWNRLVNKSLKYYITNKLNSKEVKKLIKNSDAESAKYLDEYVRNNIDNHWNM